MKSPLFFTWSQSSKLEALSTKLEAAFTENERLKDLLVARNTKIQALKTSHERLNKETAMPKPTDFYVIIPDHTQLEPICPQSSWDPTQTRIDLIVQGCNIVFQCETINNTLVIRTTNPKYVCEALADEGVVHTVCYDETQAKNITTNANRYSTLVFITKDLRSELEETRIELEDKESDFDDLHSQFVALTIKHKALKTENQALKTENSSLGVENEELLQRLAAPNLSRLVNHNEPSTKHEDLKPSGWKAHTGPTWEDLSIENKALRNENEQQQAKIKEQRSKNIELADQLAYPTADDKNLLEVIVSLCTANKELADTLLMTYTKRVS